MSTFKKFFENCEAMASSLNHNAVTIDHVSACVLGHDSVIEFFKSINMDAAQIHKTVHDFLKTTNMPQLADRVIEEAESTGRVPYTPILSRIYFELSKASVIEQLKNTPDGIDSFFILIECLSFPESALSNAIELEGSSIEQVSRKLYEYKLVKDAKVTLNVAMRDSEEDFDSENKEEEEQQTSKGSKVIGKAVTAFTDDLTDQARKGKLQPIIGREVEMFDMAQVLSRKNKKNAALIGEAGVGKTQIVEGFALKIVNGDVPETLKGFTLLSLNMTTLTAGTKFRGELEERVDRLIKELERHDNVILFIDEMHTIMQAGSGSGGNMDFGAMFKPALSRGTLRVIGATTYAEYRSHIEKDSAIARRFTKIDVVEPTIEETTEILKGVSKTYEKFHNVKVEKDALAAIMEYSVKFLQNKKFPDKAIDLLDASCARRRVKASDAVVTRDDIAYEVSRVANIPLEVVSCKESDRMRNLKESLKSRVFGQDEAVESLVKNVMVARAGLRDSQSIQGAFLFVGPSGTGKTEITKALAESMGVEMVRFDMSEFAQEHTVAKLIGSPPGYVGHDSGNGALLDKVEQHPNCVLLLDEIEKAHPKVLLTFLQVMDEGRLTGSQGKTVHFNNVTMIMTTNLGARDAKAVPTGFGNTQGDGMDVAVKKFLPPEFINRIDSMVKFSELSSEAINSVVDKYISLMNEDLKSKKVKVKVSKSAKAWLAQHGVQPGMGARPMKRLITEHIRVPLAEEMLYGALVSGGVASFTVKDNKLVIVPPKTKE